MIAGRLGDGERQALEARVLDGELHQLRALRVGEVPALQHAGQGSSLFKP